MTGVEASYAYCEKVTRKQAGNFFPAMQVLPRAKRRAMYALYTFSRLTDDIADGDGTNDAKIDALHQWRRSLDEALAGADPHPSLPAVAHAAQAYRIPVTHFHAVIQGCLLDVTQHRYQSFPELHRYCELVASSVGQACIHIWGFHGERASQYAEAAGVALQLTNILRDLGEDRARGRVYIPQKELALFGCDQDRICDSPEDPKFQKLMRFQVDRARRYYEEAALLDGCLEKSGRAVYRGILETYYGLLDRIEALKYDVFSKRVRLTNWRKARIALRTLPLRWGWKRG